MGILFLTLTTGFSQDPVKLQEGASNRPSISAPLEGDLATLRQFIANTKKLRPQTVEHYLEMQQGIRDASQKMMSLISDKSSQEFQNAEMDFVSSSVMLLGNKGERSQQKTFEKFRDYLASKKKLGSNDLQMALLAGQNLEQLEDSALACKAYETFAKILEDKDADSFRSVIEIMRASIRRLKLVGEKLDLQGRTISGDEFNMTSLKGKVRLVYVWASWSRPCVDEYPYMKKLYDTYHSLGFEIIGICLDDNQADIEKFLTSHPMPWGNLWDGKEPRVHPFTKEYGISAVPTMILVDREGKVVSIEARGVPLGIALDRMLGN